MPPRKKGVKSSRAQPASSSRDAAKQSLPRVTRVPALIRNIALALVSLCLSSGLFVLTAEYTLSHLDSLSKGHDETETFALVAWKFTELGFALFMGFSGKTD